MKVRQVMDGPELDLAISALTHSTDLPVYPNLIHNFSPSYLGSGGQELMHHYLQLQTALGLWVYQFYTYRT